MYVNYLIHVFEEKVFNQNNVIFNFKYFKHYKFKAKLSLAFEIFVFHALI